jgi:hypothetical protein
MQQSFQDNMGALSSQFDNLSTNESIQDISQRQLGMKMDGNERKNPSPISVSAFYHRKRDRVRNSRERKRERDKPNCENERKRKY